VQAAPGQVTTLFLRGLPRAAGGSLRSGQSSDVPLPKSLAGISVAILQGQSTLTAPLFAVRQENTCPADAAADPACLLTSIRLQIPFDLAAGISLVDQRVVYAPLAGVRVDVDGQPGVQFALQPLPDNAHVLTNCDVSWDTKPDSVCSRRVYHADGTPADENAPASGGETVVVYAYGLGATSPAVETGTASPPGVAGTDLLGYPRVYVTLTQNFLNVIGSGPRTPDFPLGAFLPIDFAGLVPKQVGMYQLNIRLPSPLSSYPCGDWVHSNALLRVNTLQGTENIALCVKP
jgi:hypothetical protein